MAKLVLIPVVLYFVCICVGYVVCKMTNQEYAITKFIIYGYIICVALFHIIAIPFMYFTSSFSILYYLFLAICILLVCCAVWTLIKEQKKLKSNIKYNIKNLYNDKKEISLIAISIFLVLFQVAYVVYYQHTDIDDSYYIAQMNTILHTNKVLAIDPASGISDFLMSNQYKMVSYEVLYSVIIKLFNVNAAFLSHTIMPVFLIPLHYIIVYMIGKSISGKNSCIFVIIFSALNMYSGYSGYSQGAFLLYRIWQGKAVMVNIVLLTLIYVFYELYKESEIGISKIVFLTFILLAGFHTTTVGIYLMPIAYFALFGGYLITTRNLKNSIKLCTPVVWVIPVVLLKAKDLLISGEKTQAVSAGSVASGDVISYSTEFIDKYLNGYSGIIIIYIIALIIVWIYGTRAEKGIHIVSTLVLGVTFLNPLAIGFVSNNITGVSVYWRLFWIMEIPLAIAVALNMLVEKCKDENVFVTAGVGILIIIVSGNYILNSTGFEHRTNRYKLDAHAVEIADKINSDADNQEVRLLLPVEWSYGIREYCGNIELLLNRYTSNGFSEAGKTSELEEFYTDLVNPLYTAKEWDAKKLEEELRTFEIDYVVVLKESMTTNEVSENLKEIYDNSEYVIYKCTNL